MFKLIPARRCRLAAMLRPRSGLWLLFGLMAAFQLAAPAWADTCPGGPITPNGMRMGGGPMPVNSLICW